MLHGWLILLLSLPPRPSSLRVRAWRRLRALGAVALKGGAYLLPDTGDRYEQFQWLAQEVQRDGGDAFVSMLARMIRRAPLVPVLGTGRYRLQPIPVEQVAEGFARVLRAPAGVGQTYDVAGPVPYAFVDLLDEIGHAIGRARVRKVHVPLGPVRILTRALAWLPFYPVSTDQLTMLEEESVGDPSRFFADLGVKPEPLPVGLHRMLGPS
jgi:nucleoside-diphosphate-sugar epimerase